MEFYNTDKTGPFLRAKSGKRAHTLEQSLPTLATVAGQSLYLFGIQNRLVAGG